ncbi:MAG: molybdopterin molybdotransferase MoeA [Opitutae bacterium]|nr:molybdopterin molybdotransferase MoeA [Opitutae bacterium]
MPPDPSLTSYADALAAVLAEAGRLGPETIAGADAPGRILAQDLVAPFDLPRFDNTAVDGYAIHAADVERANRDGGADLSLGMIVPAGEALRGRELTPGLAARVLTGSPLPAGTAAVVMQEDVEPRGEILRLSPGISPGQCIRRQGEEFRRGDLVARRTQPLTPPLCALAATLGLAQISVARAPRVGLLVTGSELIAPGQPLGDAQIYESNGAGLAAALRLAGLASLDVRSVPDTLAPTVAALAALLDAHDVVITSGGVSVGAYDAVKEALQQLGVERRLWRVAIKPGKPFFFGVRERAGHQTAVFGLPGNPLSALVTFSVFAFPDPEDRRPPRVRAGHAHVRCGRMARDSARPARVAHARQLRAGARPRPFPRRPRNARRRPVHRVSISPVERSGSALIPTRNPGLSTDLDAIHDHNAALEGFCWPAECRPSSRNSRTGRSRSLHFNQTVLLTN